MRLCHEVPLQFIAPFSCFFFRNLLFVRNYEGDFEDLALNFVVVEDHFGVQQVWSEKFPFNENSTLGRNSTTSVLADN